MTVFWCAGMYASGSTWAYNVIRAIAAATYPARRRTSRFANTVADLAGIEDDASLHVVKTHDLPRDATAVLLAQSPAIIATIRDPRDAVTSLIRYQHFGFEQAGQTITKSANFIARLMERANPLVLRFEDRFSEDPETVMRIAAALGVELDPSVALGIFAAHQREVVEKFIGVLKDDPAARHDPRSGDFYDPATQWHRHHAGRDGEIGRWRRILAPGQPAAIEADCAAAMARFGYKPEPLHMQGYSLKVGGFKLDI
ncbi:MAG: sulfotransferase domain-containing protein [Alphaproteobacteria bacterium]|nr:sulfotransferase domain-containing protein [Alphaproteobacteria bacterium]